MKRFIILLLVLGFLFTAVAPIALGAPPAAPASGQGLEISPPVIELTADPGQTVTATIKLRNVTQTPIVATGTADDFGAKGEEGQPEILLDETESTRYSLKFWIDQVPSVTLNPQEQKTISVAIKVPANAEPGGHFGVIRFTGAAVGVEGSGVSLSASLGTLVLLRISGQIVEKASLIEMFAVHNGNRGTFFDAGPITLSQRVRNQGSVHTKPTGSVEIFDIFGRKVATLPVNDPARNVLPDSVRRFDQTWDKKFLFGRYRARVDLTHGPDKQALSQSIVFWVIPWGLLALVLVVLVALVIVIRASLRSYNRRVIERYQKRR